MFLYIEQPVRIKNIYNGLINNYQRRNYGISILRRFSLDFYCFLSSLFLAVNKLITDKTKIPSYLITENSGFIKYYLNKLDRIIPIIDINLFSIYAEENIMK